jgi:Zn-dependent protease with chaperone function
MILFAASAYSLPPELLAKAQALEHLRTALHFGGAAWTLVWLWLLVRGRLGERIAGLGERVSRRPWLAGLVVAPLWLLVLAAIALPLELAGHRVALAYGISTEAWLPWWADWLRSLALSMAVGTPVLSTLYALLRHRGRAWWLWFWLLSLPCMVFAVYVEPVLIDPIFNRFTPLQARDPALVAQLEQVVARSPLTIPPARMFVMDASTRTNGLNAYVTGFGRSKRIVVWDTTLAQAPVDEIVSIYGHEQGHYVLNHIWKGMAFAAALMLVFYWLGARLLRMIVRRRGDAWHIRSEDDWSSVGLLLLLSTALSFLAEPPANAFSRAIEHQADVYGLEITSGLLPNAGATAVRVENRLGRVWLEDPSPNRFVVWWTYTHPTASERADFALNFEQAASREARRPPAPR